MDEATAASLASAHALSLRRQKGSFGTRGGGSKKDWTCQHPSHLYSMSSLPERPGRRPEAGHLGLLLLLLLPPPGMLEVATLGACSDLAGCDLHPLRW